MQDLRRQLTLALASLCLIGLCASALFGQAGDIRFKTEVLPILAENCFSCHTGDTYEGNMSFDELLGDEDSEHRTATWHRILQQLQAGLMPPASEAQPAVEQIDQLRNWIKYDAFGLKADSPDPGRVTIRRLNQVEYRNTIRDLLGVDYDTSTNFPADDTGHGFDNIGDVLSMSPLLLEKYVNAAKDIVSSVVPVVPGIVRAQRLHGDEFTLLNDAGVQEPQASAPKMGGSGNRHLSMSYYEPLNATADLL